MTAQDELIKLVVQAADKLGIDIMLIGAWARDHWAARFDMQGNISTALMRTRGFMPKTVSTPICLPPRISICGSPEPN